VLLPLISVATRRRGSVSAFGLDHRPAVAVVDDVRQCRRRPGNWTDLRARSSSSGSSGSSGVLLSDELASFRTTPGNLPTRLVTCVGNIETNETWLRPALAFSY